MKRRIPDDLINYIHEFIDYKSIHKIKFKKVLHQVISRDVCEIHTISEFIIVILCIVMTIFLPVMYEIYGPDTEILNIYVYLFCIKCVFSFMMDYILVMNIVKYLNECCVCSTTL